jgi:hypothetical protein
VANYFGDPARVLQLAVGAFDKTDAEGAHRFFKNSRKPPCV